MTSVKLAAFRSSPLGIDMTADRRKETALAVAATKFAPEASLSRYFQEIRRFPMLSPGEEQVLAKRWRDSGDMDAAHRLVNAHLRLVAKIAMGYRGYGLPVGELIGEGNVGMMLAVKRFDPERGFRLATYAMWWIRAAIQEYILRSWSLVKMGTTAAQKKLFFNLRRLKGQMAAMDDGDLQPEQVAKIAKVLVVPEHDVVSMNRRLVADLSLNAPVLQEGEGGEWQDRLVDGSESQETAIGDHEEFAGRMAVLSAGLKTLNERERHIIAERRLKDEPTTLEELGKHFRVSRERIRQIEVLAFGKLQTAMKMQIAAAGRMHARPPAAAMRLAGAGPVGSERETWAPPDAGRKKALSGVTCSGLDTIR
jgi:RNA polymerase sigma-32 factor